MTQNQFKFKISRENLDQPDPTRHIAKTDKGEYFKSDKSNSKYNLDVFVFSFNYNWCPQYVINSKYIVAPFKGQFLLWGGVCEKQNYCLKKILN